MENNLYSKTATEPCPKQRLVVTKYETNSSEACPKTAPARARSIGNCTVTEEETDFNKESLPSLGVADPDKNSRKLLIESLDFASLSIHGDTVTRKGKQAISSLLDSSSLEDDDALFEEKNKIQEQVSLPPKVSVKLGFGNRKKLLILDLNGVLADAVSTYSVGYGEQKVFSGKQYFKRPFCDVFLEFCFDRFDVGVWSSIRRHNLDGAVDSILGKLKNKLLFCWDQSKCSYTGVNTLENRQKPLFLKELKKLWNKEEPGLPWKKGDYSSANTLLVDDSPYKAICNPPHTAIFPHPYRCNTGIDASLGPGGDLRVYLEQVVVADDVQQYVKEHPFGQEAITDSNKDWNFYSQIIKRHNRMLTA
ncbi:hypothetical protein HPP92_020982 [Vanilla planifolia]|uniref:Mitochondrial import inner membrane translocase subunit TIM50 n=1 Tax=Vanilla planifolia TaxID=51239 RepID=A0A835PUS2_VANPL|nr:hypothetical protein HPP92_020982 [Vanilla planifolia]